MNHTKKQAKLFPFLLLLTCIFLIMEIAGYIETSSSAGFVAALLESKNIHIPASVFGAQLWFLFAQTALYVGYTFLIWLVARLLGILFACRWEMTCRLGFWLWFIASITVLFANQVNYPASGFAHLTTVIFPPSLAVFLMWTGVAILSLAGILACCGLLKLIWQRSRVVQLSVIIFAVLGTLLWFDFSRSAVALTNKKMTTISPNVIIIGIDSLRPDYTDFGGYVGPAPITPHLDQLVDRATIFSQATTPLARTFPSWAAILTGQYPAHNGVRYNLTYQAHLKLQNTLANILKHHGYYTVYATDDRRFSNVSHKFGFLRLIGPPEGANDFFLGTINQLPLDNLMINTRLGEYLFPYSYGNRPAYQNYKPQSFNTMVEQKLLHSPRNKPLFLAIHFCMPHWPYIWSGKSYNTMMLPIGLYTEGVHRVDSQAGQFIHFLRVHHYLDHAIVIVLSDHGEGLLKPYGRLISKAGYIKGPHSIKGIFDKLNANFMIQNYSFNTSYGHGTDVLNLHQYHTVFALKTFGLRQVNKAGTITTPVSLIDIKPTILAMLNLPSPQTDGRSLASFVYTLNEQMKPRPIFVESGFTPATTARHNGEAMTNLIIQGAKVFKILPNNKIIVKPSVIHRVLLTKQREELYKNWALALYGEGDGKVIPVLVNRKTGQWTDDFSTPFAKHSPVKFMLKKMKALYGHEVDQYYPYVTLQQ